MPQVELRARLIAPVPLASRMPHTSRLGTTLMRRQPYHHQQSHVADSDADCLFCRIARGETPAHIVHADERIVAFLDIHPIRAGHIQIIPRAHHAYFDDLPPDLAAAILHLGQRLAPILKRLYRVQRVALLFTGGDIPHAHAHLVPMVEGSDITSRRYIAEERLTFRNTPRATEDELAVTARATRERLGSC
jgi:histidine triad (HIT) family protein